MDAWHRNWKGDIALRLAGALLCGIAFLAFRSLLMSPPDAHHPGVAAFVLAALGFISSCAGSALAMVGKRLFDRVEVGERWRRQLVQELRLATQLRSSDR